MTKLLVATGAYNLKSAEIVNLDDSDPDLVCDDLPDLPADLFGAVGHLVAILSINFGLNVFGNFFEL
jgi:hypothetical protein